MVVTLSDYILEQEVSTASCDEIVFEQLQAEIDVNTAIVSAYAKQLAMLEFASGYTMEADTSTSTEQKKGFFSKLWGGIKKVWKAICDWFGRRIQSIKRFFGRDNKNDPMAVENLIANLEKLPPEAKASFRCPGIIKGKIDKFLNYVEIMEGKFLPLLDQYIETASHVSEDKYDTAQKLKSIEEKIGEVQTEVDRVSGKVEDFYKDAKNVSAQEEMNYDETMKTLKDLKNKFSDNLKSRLDTMQAAAKALRSKIDKLDGMPDIDESVNEANAKTAGNYYVTKAYFTTSLDKVTKMVTDIQKKLDDDIASIEKSLKGIHEKWLQYKKNNAKADEISRKEEDKKAGRIHIDRSRLGDGYKDATDEQLRSFINAGYDIYSND